MKKYTVQLDAKQRTLLQSILTGGKESARNQMHARIVLKADQGAQGASWTDQQIAEALEVGTATVERVRKRFVQGGLFDALVRRPQPERPALRKVDGELEARLVTLACSQTEEGRERWTMRLLADKLVQLGYVDQISHQTVWVTLKKMNSNPGSKSSFVFHPKPMQILCITWKTCFPCINVHTIHGCRRSVWMREANNYSRIPASRSRCTWAKQSASTTSMNEKECVACLSRSNPKREPACFA